jgi:hypothetical protein
MNWRIVVAVIVAFVVGAAGGGFAEHQRVKNERSNNSARSTSTTAAAPNWFGSKKASACPELQRWRTALGVASYTAVSKGPWANVRAKLLTQRAAMQSAYRALVPLAGAPGKVQLEFLVAYETQVTTALKAAASAAAYAKTPAAKSSPRVKHDVGILLTTATSCAKAKT